MTPRDQKLLEKQLHGIDNRPPEGIFMLAWRLADSCSDYTDQPPLGMAVNDVAAQTSQPALPTMR